jgi:FkbM family methyltransferase
VIAAIPAGFGQPRLADPLYRRRLAGGPPMRAKARLRGGAQVELDLRDRIQGTTFLTRDYEPALVRFLASKLAGGGVFVDVGAHVGLVSLSVACRCRPAKVQVHAFEPDPDNAAGFQRNIELNPALNVVLNQLAVGASGGRAVLRRVSEQERACATIVESANPGGTDELGVDCISLVEYAEERGISEIEVLKIDVEGYEPLVFDGVEPLLRERRVNWVVFEVNDRRLAEKGSSREQLFDRLHRHGYRRAHIPQLGLRRIIPRPARKMPDEDVAFHLDPAGAPRST